MQTREDLNGGAKAALTCTAVVDTDFAPPVTSNIHVAGLTPCSIFAQPVQWVVVLAPRVHDYKHGDKCCVIPVGVHT